MIKDFLKEKALKFGLELDDKTLEKLEIFYEFLNEFNEHTNLIAKADEKTVLTKHFLDSMSFNKLPITSKKFKLLDVGSGGGFPSIVISIIFPDAEITAVDSVGKKVNFLNQAAEKIGLKNFKALNTRVEDLPQNFRENFDFVTARAVAQLNILAEYCLPFVKTGGCFVAYKAKTAKEELKEAKKAIQTLGGSVAEVIDYSLGEDAERNLVVIEKVSKTPQKFPRKAGLPKKNPL